MQRGGFVLIRSFRRPRSRVICVSGSTAARCRRRSAGRARRGCTAGHRHPLLGTRAGGTALRFQAVFAAQPVQGREQSPGDGDRAGGCALPPWGRCHPPAPSPLQGEELLLLFLRVQDPLEMHPWRRIPGGSQVPSPRDRGHSIRLVMSHKRNLWGFSVPIPSHLCFPRSKPTARLKSRHTPAACTCQLGFGGTETPLRDMAPRSPCRASNRTAHGGAAGVSRWLSLGGCRSR